jgi:hypothetical protein
LEAEVAALRAERDNARRVNDLEAELSNPNSPAFIPTEYVRFLMSEAKTAIADRDAYRARIRELRKYVSHTYECVPTTGGGCSCGLRAALDGDA